MAVHLPILGTPARAPAPERPKRAPIELSSALLFERSFLPLYPAEARRDLAAARRADANPAKNPAIFAQIDEIARVFALLAPAAFGADDLDLDFSDASVHRLGARLSRELRDLWLRPQAGGAPAMIVN